ncbi:MULTISPECIES: hypothetical protein [Burkholderiaceae]|uniref:hypothetical protein n=1 Tax=Burkholderiaceae TaxID=119060 RepID=UPI00147985FD|nr:MULTISPECIES: hypothetical protein [Burkholderiaceae]MCG1040411.1 hypothetical protein [Mycetohabitans sp. B7]
MSEQDAVPHRRRFSDAFRQAGVPSLMAFNSSSSPEQLATDAISTSIFGGPE